MAFWFFVLRRKERESCSDPRPCNKFESGSPLDRTLELRTCSLCSFTPINFPWVAFTVFIIRLVWRTILLYDTKNTRLGGVKGTKGVKVGGSLMINRRGFRVEEKKTLSWGGREENLILGWEKRKLFRKKIWLEIPPYSDKRLERTL